MHCLETIADFKLQKQGSLSSFRPLSGRVCTDLFENNGEFKARPFVCNTIFNSLLSHLSIPLNNDLAGSCSYGQSGFPDMPTLNQCCVD
jgi:hypothetical protein